jgi:hypothetical protein
MISSGWSRMNIAPTKKPATDLAPHALAPTVTRREFGAELLGLVAGAAASLSPSTAGTAAERGAPPTVLVVRNLKKLQASREAGL